MAILAHTRTLDQKTPHRAAREALKQADIWGAAEALELEIDPSTGTEGMTLYISGPLHRIIDLYEKAKDIGAEPEISHIEVDTQEDEEILRCYLGDEPEIVNPGRLPAQTPKAS